MIKNLFHVGQKVECRLDEKFYSGTVTEVHDDHIIVDVPEVSDHCWFEENFNIGCVYPQEVVIMSKYFFTSLDFVTIVKKQYMRNDICMSELLRMHDELTVSQKRELLLWSGDDEFMQVTETGELVRKAYV